MRFYSKIKFKKTLKCFYNYGCCNRLFTNYYIAIYAYGRVTGTDFTMMFLKMPQHPLPTGMEYLSLSGLYVFQTLTLSVKISQIQPCWCCILNVANSENAVHKTKCSTHIYV